MLKLTYLTQLTLVLCFSSLLKLAVQDRILGCNGFIKSDIPIDYSKVEVKLISKEGNLKDRIECAPNNGYFFLPVYDKGEYILQVSSIYKWVFEPNEIKVNFDGISDICSKGYDLIFTFKGFRVFGKVGAVAERKAPKGIKISLVADLPIEQKEINSVFTEENGAFDISPVLPGSYIIKASHPRWSISKSLFAFSVTNTSYEIPPNSLLFTGYDVTGSVVSNGEPIDGVKFILFSTSDTLIETNWLFGCNSSAIEGFSIADIKLSNMQLLCHVTSNDKGIFLFLSVPSGSYVIVPFYQSMNSLKFDVYPRIVRFSVAQDSYIFSKPFQVSGFSVIGHIVSRSVNGEPIPAVKIILNKEKTTETNEGGVFMFEGVKTGTHHIQVEADDFQFNDFEVKIAPNSAALANIYPEAFKTCGNVQKLQSVQITVKFVDINDREYHAQTDDNGDYCLFLAPGDYTVNVSPSVSEFEKILWFFPVNYELQVTDKPLKDINFKQETAQLTGIVQCLDDDVCDEVNMIFRSLDSFEEEYRVITQDGKYKFTNLYPGHYELSVFNNKNWCWEFRVQSIYISQIQNEAPTFRRIGILFTISVSHGTMLKYQKLTPNVTILKEGTLNLKKGIHQYCLPGEAVYQLEPIGCHRFTESVIRREIGQKSLVLNFLSHEMTGFILSTEIVNDLFVNIYSNHNTTLEMRVGPLKYSIDKNHSGGYLYVFQFQAAFNQELTIIPESSSLLFTPPHLTVRGKSDCAELDEYIVAKSGIRFQGSVQPALENVKISVLNELDEIVVSTLTDTEGKYQFMPLQSDHQYRVIGEKEGYILSGPFENGLFQAHKLAEIQVSLIDDDGKPLQGVLLSLSGGENYRQTSQSTADGKITFLSLKPSEYYLRPNLKEYKFLPSSDVVNIKEGETVSIVFKGHRVLYSIFGSVSSLNRFVEKDVVVEAVSVAIGECMLHQEEGTTDENGHFRIRGLHPQCGYNVRLKKGVSVNKNILKSLPENIFVKVNTTDVEDINLIALPEATQCDVSVFLELDSAEHLRTLQLKLLDDDGGVVHTLKLGDWKTSRYPLKSVLLPFPTLPLNNMNYCVQMDSSLSKAAFTYVPQTVYFTANNTFHLIKLSFRPELKLSDSEIKHSYTMAIIIVLLALMYWYKDMLSLALMQLQMNSRITLPDCLSRYSQPYKGKDNEKTFIEFEPGLTVVKRKIKPRKM